MAARTIRAGLSLCGETPPGRRAARADELWPPRHQFRAGDLLSRHRIAVQQRLRMLTAGLADGLRNGGVGIPDAAVRAPHILSLHFPAGIPERLIEQLAAEHIYVAPRVGRMRISPHVYNDEEDIDRFVETLRRLTCSRA